MIFFQKKVDKFYNSLQNIIILYSGKKIKDELLQKINKNNIFIPIMSTDLIKYKSIKNLKTQDEMVFIDQNLSGHADFLLNGQKMIDTFEYYEKLNKIFDFLEKKFSAKVVIAARFSNPYLSKFKNRKIIQGNTMEEIKKSKLVIGHFSTALGAVTIEKKPLLLLITNNLPNENKLYIELFSKELGAQILSMDLEDSLPKEINLNINFEKYENYYKNYLYDGNEKMILTKDIILKLIKEV